MGERPIARTLRSIVVLPALLLMVPAAAQASVPDDPLEPVTSTSVPVDTTVPTPSTPSTSERVGTVLVGVDETGDTDATAITWLGIVGAVVLVGVAVWWMTRRDEDDEFVAHPDDDWPRDSRVI